MVLRRRAQQGGPADVDLLDRVVPIHVEAADGLLEGIEVDADEVDRLDPVRGEVRDVLRDVATGEDAAVHGRVQRDDAMAEHLGEAGELLERDHRDAPSLSSRAVPPLATSSKPRRRSSSANAATPVLS